MHWIKISPGCDMPEEGERLLVMTAAGWTEGEYGEGYFGYEIGGEEITGATHWLRVPPLVK